MDGIDLNKMNLDEVLAYIHERELFYMKLLIDIDGFERTCEILAENGKI